MPYITTDGVTPMDPDYRATRPQDPMTRRDVEEVVAQLLENIAITDTVLPTAYAGRGYAHTFAASGYGHLWSINTSTIDGDAIDPDTGAYAIPLVPAPGTYLVQVAVTNGLRSDSKALTLTVVEDPGAPAYLLSDGSVELVPGYVPTGARSIMTAQDIIALATPKPGQHAPVITNAGVIEIDPGASGSYQLIATGYPVPTFAKDSGETWPAGITIDSAGLISWTDQTAAAGTSSDDLHVTAANAVGDDVVVIQFRVLPIEQDAAQLGGVILVSANVQAALSSAARLSAADSRWFSKLNPAVPWAQQPSLLIFQGPAPSGYYPSNPKINTIPAAGLPALDRSGNVIPGAYALQRLQDPSGAWFIRCIVDKDWHPWGTGDTTSRAEIYSDYNASYTVQRGQAYIGAFIYRPQADVFGHGGNDLDIHNFHQNVYTAPDANDTTSFPSVRMYFASANSGRCILSWEPNQPSLLANIQGGLNGAGSTTIGSRTDYVAGQWVIYIMRFMLHWDAAQSPYFYLYRAGLTGALELIGSRVGPNAYNDAPTGMAQKKGCYKWDQTWGSKTRRTVDSGGWWIARDVAGAAGEPATITPDILLSFIRANVIY